MYVSKSAVQICEWLEEKAETNFVSFVKNAFNKKISDTVRR